MKMPSRPSTWFMIVYFLLVGLAALGVFSAPGWLTGIAAVGAAVLLFLGR